MRTSAWCRRRNTQVQTCLGSQFSFELALPTNTDLNPGSVPIYNNESSQTYETALSDGKTETRCSMQRCWSSNNSHLALSKMAIIRPPLLVTVSGNLSERVRGRDTLCQRKWSMSSQIRLNPRLMKSGRDRQFPKSTAAIMARSQNTFWKQFDNTQ